MRFVGVDIGKESHVVAAVDESQAVLVKPTAIAEDAAGYSRLLELLGAPDKTLVAMEATGHSWQDLFALLASKGFAIALLNPLRTRRFAEEDLVRAKTDAIDALAIARFAAQKRPAVTRLSDEATMELRELVRLRERRVQELGDHVRQLHRLVDLGFPELTRHVKSLDSALAKALIEAAKTSVGAHHGEVYQLQVRTLCEDITTLRERLRRIDGEIERTLEAHEVGKLLTTIDGIGPHSAARIIRALWMPTLTAVRRNAWLRAFYAGLRARGKLPKVALVAAMRKLLCAVYSVAKNRQPFVPRLPAPAVAPA